MKQCVGILAGATAVFMILAMAQEWQTFATSWLGSQQPAVVLSNEEQRGAENALREYLTISSHLYRSNGDPRFLDRLPAGQEVAADLMDDIGYLRHNGRFQDPILQHLEISASRLMSRGNIEMSTREYWIIHVRFVEDGSESDPVRSVIVNARYWLTRDGSRWVVRRVELADPTQGGPSGAELLDR